MIPLNQAAPSDSTTLEDYQALLELVTQAVWETDADGTVVTDSPSWRAYTGQTVAEWLGKGWLGAVHPDDRDYALDQWRQAVTRQQPVNAEFRLRAPGTGWRWTNVRATSVYNPNGSVKKWVGLNVDISARKAAELQLQQREQLLNTLVQHLPGGAAFVIDRQLRYQLAEGEALSEAGMNSADLVGKTIFEALDADTAAAYEPRLQQALAGKPFVTEHHVGGHYFQSKGVPLADADGQISAVLVLSHDITERYRAEEALRQSEANLLTLFEALPVGIALMDAAGKTILSNEQMRRFLPNGLIPSKDKSRAWRWRGYYVTGQPVEVNDYPGSRAMRGESGGPIEFLYAADDGNEVWTRVNYFPVRLPVGAVSRYVCLITDIDALKRNAEALRESEERLRTLLQNLPDYAIFRLDVAGIITEWTEGAQRVTGYAAPAAIGQHLSLFYLPDVVAAGKVEAELTEAARMGRTEREGPRLRQNGELIFVNEIATAIYSEAGALTGFTKISRDITARKADQERLRLLEERTRIAVEAAAMGTWEWNLLTNEVYWNEQHFELFGMPPQPQPLTPADFSRHVHPDDQDWVLAELNRAIRERTPYDAEFRALREDTGQTVWMSGYGRVTAEVDGQPSRINGVMFDITARRQAEEALRDSRQRLQIILDSIADHAILTFAPDTIITSWNRGAEQLFGYPAREAIGQSARLIFTPEDQAAGELEKEMRLAQRDGRTPDERDHLRQDGSRLYVLGVLSPLYEADGQLVGYVKVARDLSERRYMEQALRQTDQRKNEFLAMLAHELRNPLAPLRSGLQFLSMTRADDPALGPLLPVMNRQMTHMVRLVDDLLDVSRISQGKIELRKELVDLTWVVSQAVDVMRPLYASAGKQLMVKLPDLPLHLSGDLTRLSQVVTNLLTNGIRYTREDGQVWLSLDQAMESTQPIRAVLRVRDNGIGLATDQLKAIFELFVQVDTSLARSNGGLGLGLTLVQQLVEMHGGQVEAHSPGLGKGSEFIVYLPLV